MLNNKLKKFINGKNGYFLIIGSPGTGKTNILVETIKFLVDYKKIDARKILVLSFNRRWSKILRDKTSQSIGRSIFEIPVTTFFSFCTNFLERANLLLDLKPGQISVMNAPEQWQLLTEVISCLEKENYPLTSRYLSSNSFVANSYMQEVFDFILRAQENLISPRELSNKFSPFFDTQLSEITGIYIRYEKELIDRNLYNYGRLLKDTVNILKNNEDIRQIFKKKYEFILIDELQETNKAQLEIVRNLSDKNCIFFGNDDESIYSFRGSAINNFNRIYDVISKNNKKSVNILMLKTNYRSSSAINDVCNKFIRANKERIEKKCKTPKNTADNTADESEEDLIVKELKTTLDEVNFICEKIKYLQVYKKIKFEEICIVVKGTGYKTKLLENILTQNKISFTRRNSRTLLDNIYVQYVINFLKLIDTLKFFSLFPDEDKSIPNKLIENFLISGFTGLNPIFVKKLIGDPGSIWNFMVSTSKYKKDKKRADKNLNIKKLTDIFKFISEFLGLSDLNCYDFVMNFVTDKRAGLTKLMFGNGKNKAAIGKEGSVSVLGDYLESIKEFTGKNTGKNSIKDYLKFLEGIMENNFIEEIEESTKEFMFEGSVNILSFHQVKGLEFEAVFLPFANKNYLPSVFGSSQLYDMQIFNYMSGEASLSLKELKDIHMQGERKLFYTGLTRAKKYLFVTANKMEGQSIFYEEISRSVSVLKKISKSKKNASRKKPALRSELKKNWLERKRVTTSTYKLLKGLKINIIDYLKELYYLKYSYPYESWWNPRYETKNINNPFLMFPPIYSYSSLNSFMECPFKYKIRYFIRMAEEGNLSILIGSIYHRILKLFFGDKSAKLSWSRLENIISNVFDENVFELAHIKNELESKAREEFKSYFDNYLPAFPDRSVMEKEFAFKIGDDTIKGRIDQINFIDNDTVELIDFKSGSKRAALVDFEKEIQLKLYNLAMKSSDDLIFLKGKKSILKYIFLGEVQNSVVTIPEGYCLKGDFKEFVKNLINDIKNEQFDAEPESNFLCSECKYKVICPRYNAG
ncbi:MAG: ATP-dependent helicase [Actinobacteria bacterium]|nr:ATP-dependent helicase [Actinomycetota bacterium]